MNVRKVMVWGIMVIALVFSATWAVAQSGGEWTVGRWVAAGGGGTSSGGNFRVSGSIGQPEAGDALSGGQFVLRGGFWPGERGPAPTPTPTRPSAPGISPLKLPYLLGK